MAPDRRLSPQGAAAAAVADLVRARGRVPYEQLRDAVGDRAILVARARGLLRVAGLADHAELLPGSGIPLYGLDWHEREWRAGRWGRS